MWLHFENNSTLAMYIAQERKTFSLKVFGIYEEFIFVTEKAKFSWNLGKDYKSFSIVTTCGPNGH